MWFVAANMYYGVVLLSTELLNSSADTCGGAAEGTTEAYEEVECSLHKCRLTETLKILRLLVKKILN